LQVTIHCAWREKSPPHFVASFFSLACDSLQHVLLPREPNSCWIFLGLTCAWRAVAGSQTRPLSAAEVGGRVPPGWSPSPAARGPSLSLPTGYVDPTSPSLRSRARRPRPDGLVDIEVGAAVVAPALPTSPTFWTPWRSAPRQAVAQPSRRAVAQQHDTAVLRCSIFYLRQTTYQDA
jgi:hypothetical protein